MSAARKLTAEQQALIVKNLRVPGAVAARYARNPRDYPDLFGYACLGFCESMLSFDPTVSRIGNSGWAGAWNVVHRHVRAQRALKRTMPGGSYLSGDLDRTAAAPEDDDVGRREVVEAVREAIGRLHPRHRSVVEARMRGVTLRELAAEMGVSNQRVREIEQAAYARLRRTLEAGGFSPKEGA